LRKVMAIANDRKSDTFILASVAIVLSVASFVHFYTQDKILLYGDAVAHINIARRVFDSQFPGLSQLGTVWLPLPHLLMLPFIVNDRLWSSGLGGSIVSMVAYIAGAMGTAKIFWSAGLFAGEGDTSSRNRLAGWIAAVVYLLNPNLLYLQSTAMTEPLGLALMIWALYFYCCFAAQHRKALLESIKEDAAATHERVASKALLRCALVLMAAMLTRYDYWFFAAATVIAVLFQLFARYRGFSLVRYKNQIQQNLRKRSVGFIAALTIVPAFWLAYNQMLFGNAMEFANGKYSARAIADRSIKQGNPSHPGAGDLKVAAIYYWKTARLNIGDNKAAIGVVTIALVGIVALAFSEPFVAVLMFVPFIFYSLAMAHGGIPIFVPQWWPFSYYNVRYGLQLLPAMSVGTGYAAYICSQKWNRAAGQWAVGAIIIFALTVAYVTDWTRGPVCLREAEINSAGRIELHKQIAAKLRSLPPDATFVVSLTEHVGALQRAGIPLRRTWNESSHRSGEREFAFPLTQGDYVVAFDEDPVARMVAEHPDSVTAIATFYVPGEKRCVIYKATRSAS